MAKKLSHILCQDIGISENDLSEALKTREEKGGTIGEILIQRKVLTERQLLRALSIQYDIPFWEKLPLENIAKNFTHQVPIQFLKKYLMVPLQNSRKGNAPEENHGTENQSSPEDALIVAVNDPAQFQPLDDLVGILGAQ